MKLLIAYDGSDEANRSLEALAQPAAPVPTQVLVLAPVQVWPPLPACCFGQEPDGPGKLVHEAHVLAHLAVAEAQATAEEGARRVRCRCPQWDVHGEVSVEPLPACLVHKADEWGADCVLVSNAALRRRCAFSAWTRLNGVQDGGALLRRPGTAVNTTDGATGQLR